MKRLNLLATTAVLWITCCLLLVTLLSACTGTTAPTAEPTQPPAATKAPEPTKAPEAQPQTLRLATTTSTADSGLLDFILPDFEKANNCKVDVIAVGTGQSLEIGSKGDADVVLVHSRKGEDQFVADGHAKERFDVMYNDFIIVGPKDDPAKIKGQSMAKDAFKMIMDAQASFGSRGDKSGTHTKELGVWASGKITPTQEMKWYNSLGQGMGDTLLFANEQNAYTLADRGTYLSMMDKLPNLEILVGGNNLAENKDKALLNPYGVMAVNPDTHPGVNYDLAMKFVNWLLSVDTQKKIGGYGADKFGQPLFYPSSDEYKKSMPPAAALTISGLVEKEFAPTMDELKAMNVVTVDVEHPKKGPQTGEGVRLNVLLDQAQPKADAKTLVFTASDGYTAEASLADVRQCADCLIAFNQEGNLKTMMPGFESNLWVKDVIKIEVK